MASFSISCHIQYAMLCSLPWAPLLSTSSSTHLVHLVFTKKQSGTFQSGATADGCYSHICPLASALGLSPQAVLYCTPILLTPDNRVSHDICRWLWLYCELSLKFLSFGDWAQPSLITSDCDDDFSDDYSADSPGKQRQWLGADSESV